jgi:AraC family transcriptional regulator, alkane utilization regulator
MDPLTATTVDDPITDLLRAVRIRSSVFCRSSWGAPWGVRIEPRGNPAFHLVTRGVCWLQIDDEDPQIRLATGDLAVLPRGERHALRDNPTTPAPAFDEIVGHESRHADVGGGDGQRTGLLCGGFTLEGGDTPAILHALPSVVHVRGNRGRPLPWVAATLELVRLETGSDAPGAEAVVSRLADALLIQSLRVALAELGGGDGGRLRALRDPQIAAAVELIHRHPGRAWTLDDLAAGAALSRSRFATRFRQVVGESPKRYVNRCRLAHAARLLDSTDHPLSEVAARAGYQSEFSFSKAFKQTFGLPPGTYRGRRGDQPGIALGA